MKPKADYRELTKNIFSNKKQKRREELPTKHWTILGANTPNLRRDLLTKGILCKDCHKYLAREHYSVCEKCYKKRIEKLVKSGGMRTLTPRLQKELEKELQV
jgi:hypothetical protein